LIGLFGDFPIIIKMALKYLASTYQISASISNNLSMMAHLSLSASNLQCLIPPGSLMTALYPHNPDGMTWLTSYTKEYEGLTYNDAFDIISKDDCMNLCKSHGIKARPCAPSLLNEPTVFQHEPKAELSS
jgi:hypothetical protein